MDRRRESRPTPDRRGPYRWLLELCGLRQYPERQRPVHGGRPGLKAF